MDEHFYESKKLGKEQLHPLMKRSDGPALLRFSLQFALMWGSGLFVILGYPTQPWWQLGLAMFGFALMTMSMFALGHEATHNTAFEKRWLNELALWLGAGVVYYTPTGFRQFHFAHHRHTHHLELDPEISVAKKPAPGVTSNPIIYLGYLTGLPLMAVKIGFIVGAAIGIRPIWEGFLWFVGEKYRRRMAWEARVILAFHVAWVVAGVLWLPGLLLLLVAQVVGHGILAAYLVAEHNGLSHEGDILDRTRTMSTNPLLKWIMWNMPYHTEHHAYPAVPWHALPALHELMKDELKHTERGYPRLHRRVVADLSRGQPFVES